MQGSSCRANSIIYAARAGVSTIDSTMFIAGADDLSSPQPCNVCKRVIINAGIKRVFILKDNKIFEYDVQRWVKENKKDPFSDINN